MSEIDYKEVLEQLRNRYQKNEVSPLIGAGFSKNVSKDMFMSWDELLFDMVTEIYKHEIEQSYYNQLHVRQSPLFSPKHEAKQKKDKVKEIIVRECYLNIVLQFIEYKGFREAVDVYIEERIP